MKDIKKSPFKRGLSIAKLGLKTGARAAGNYLYGQDDEEYLVSQIKLIAAEFGELKGTFMKVGQGLSMYGEHFLPPKANAFLKELQFQSPPLDWEAIEAMIEKELGLGVFQEYSIEKKALASASLGQVHKAVHKKTGQIYAMKVQYPGVAEAVESDIKNLKRAFNFIKILPAKLDWDGIFDEIKTMLHQETNYLIEKDWTQKVYELLKEDKRFVVPKVVPELTTTKVITTNFIEGYVLDSKEVKSLSQESKNQIGRAFLDHYLNELFLFKAVQTDPHLGNYRIKINDKEPPKLILFDFGAMRVVPNDFSQNFICLLESTLSQNKEAVINYGKKLKYISESDSEELQGNYYELCKLIVEPFSEEKVYDWQKSDLPKRVALAGTHLARKFKLRTPPREALFLDRKLGGTFIFLSVLGYKDSSCKWLQDKITTLK